MSQVPLPKETPSLREILRSLPSVLRFIFSLDRRLVVSLLISLCLNAPLAALLVLTIKKLTDALVERDVSHVWQWTSVLVVLSLCTVCMDLIRGRFSETFRYKIQIGLTQKWLEHLSKLSYEVLENTNFQSLSQTFERKSYMVVDICVSLMWIMANAFDCLGLSSLFFFLPWQATLIFLSAQAVRVYFMKRSRKWSWEVIDMETKEGKRASYFQSVLTRLPTLQEAKTYGFSRTLLKRWQKTSQALLDSRLRMVSANTRTSLYSDSMQFVGLVAGLIIILQSVLQGQIALSVVIVFITSLMQFQRVIANFAWNITWFSSSSVILPVFEAFFAIPEEQDQGRILPRGLLTVVFEDVWFRYPGTEQDILRGISFSFTQGDHIALVGLNGAGKSTLLKILMHMYEPSRGRILVNGINLQTIKPSAWRAALGVLTQNIQAYDDSIENQILYGDIERPKNKQRLNMATKTSNLQKVIQDLPKGLTTHVGKQYAMDHDAPIELSGGQNQMLAIARTLYRDAKIYIFDEPTSAVDAEKEEHFFSSLPEALQSRALLFVSHRFSTLRRARRILVMDAGRIIEDGTHEELLAKEGRYAELFTLQAKLYQ